MKKSRMGRVGWVYLWVSLSTSTSALAQPVTVAAEAVVVVSDVGDFIVGETLDLTYTFETSTPDSNPDPNQGFYINAVLGLTADFRTSGRSFTFGVEPFPVSNLAIVLNDNDDDTSNEIFDVLTFMNSTPERVDTVNGMNPAILQIVFSDSRIGSLPTMLDGDTVPLSAFPFSFALIQFLDPNGMPIATVVAVPNPNLPNPDDLPVFEQTIANNDGEFEILDSEQNVVGTASGELALAAGVAVESGGNQFFTFKSDAGTQTAPDFFMVGQLRIANEIHGPADLREMTVSASLRLNEGAQPAVASALSAGTDKPKFKFILTDEKGDKVATSTRDVSTSGFRTEKAEIAEFNELLDDAPSIDLKKIVDLSFGFSSTAATNPKFEFDVDSVSIPEPDIALLRIAALAGVVILRCRTRRTPSAQ